MNTNIIVLHFANSIKDEEEFSDEDSIMYET
jgi:hypothetical protein